MNANNPETAGEWGMQTGTNPSTATMDRRIQAELVALLYHNVPLAQAVLLALAILVGFGLDDVPGLQSIWLWTLAMSLIALARMYHARRYRADTVASERPAHWRRVALGGALAAGLGWSLLTLIFFPRADIVHQVFLMLILAGVVAGALPVMSANLRQYLLYEVLALLPLLLLLLTIGSGIYMLMAVACLLFMLTLARSAANQYRTLVENLQERMAKERSLQEIREINLRLHQEIGRREQIELDLMRAKEAAEAASRAKSEFLGNASHEIRTPMNGVIGMLEIALDTPLDAEQRDYLETALASAKSMLKMLTDVLDYSSLESGRLIPAWQPMNPADLARLTVESVRKAAEAKGLRLDYRLATEIPDTIVGDPGRLKQVFVHLLDNALKFTASGAIDVTLGVVATDPPHLRFSVRDTGVGIAEEKLALIFDAFTQADGSTTRLHGGLGLGLALCRAVGRMLGGRVWAESRPGEGSTFHFDFPVGDSPADALSTNQEAHG